MKSDSSTKVEVDIEKFVPSWFRMYIEVISLIKTASLNVRRSSPWFKSYVKLVREGGVMSAKYDEA